MLLIAWAIWGIIWLVLALGPELNNTISPREIGAFVYGVMTGAHAMTVIAIVILRRQGKLPK